MDGILEDEQVSKIVSDHTHNRYCTSKNELTHLCKTFFFNQDTRFAVRAAKL